MFFWFMVFVFSVLPLLVNKEFLFPYRSLFLPTIVLIIIIGFLVQQSTNIFIFYIYKIICFVAIIFFVFINISITQKYISQYDQDMLLAQKINTILIRQGLEGQNSYIVLKSEVPMDSRNTFVRTDHILSCYFQEWSALPCFTSINKNVKAIAIIHSDGRFVLQRNENYNNLLRKKPLIFLRYTQDKTVSVDRLIL